MSAFDPKQAFSSLGKCPNVGWPTQTWTETPCMNDAPLKSGGVALFKLLESLSESAWQQDLSTGQTWVSEPFWRELGYDPKSLPLSREAAREVFHTDDLSLVAAEVELQREADEPFEVEVRVHAAKEDWRWLRLRGCVTMWRDGHPTCIGGIIKDITERVVAARAKSDAKGLVSTLTKREEEVLGCLVNGAANKNIAYALGLSQRTVEGYRSRLMDKMLVKSLAELVQVALAAGVKSDCTKDCG